jgi:Ca2+-binding EF-hand superfamily protein
LQYEQALISKGTEMRYLVACVALIACSVLAMSALAQDAKKDEKKDDKRAQMREKMLKEFDANKDGKLDGEEKAKAKEKMREMRAAHKGGGGKQAGRGRKAARGAEGRLGEHLQMPTPDELFIKFDKDKDGKLSKEEFTELTKAVHERMGQMMRMMRQRAQMEGRRGGGGGGRAQFEGRRPPGPPPMGPRYNERRYAGGSDGRGSEWDGYNGPPRRRPPQWDRSAGPAGRRGDWSGGYGWGPQRGRDRDEFAQGPPRWRRGGPDGFAGPREGRPPIEGRGYARADYRNWGIDRPRGETFADGRFDGSRDDDGDRGPRGWWYRQWWGDGGGGRDRGPDGPPREGEEGRRHMRGDAERGQGPPPGAEGRRHPGADGPDRGKGPGGPRRRADKPGPPGPPDGGKPENKPPGKADGPI